MNKLIVILCLLFFISCNHPHYDYPHVVMATQFGDIELELYPAKAPKTVAAFLANVKAGIYDNSSFYRVLKAEEMPTDLNSGIIQGGVWKTAAQKAKNIPGIPHESTKQTGLLHVDGTISMARSDTGTARSEFFICIGNQNSFDFGNSGVADGQGYAAFGKVFSGMKIVRKILDQKSHGDSFDEKIEIRQVSLQ